MIPKSKIKDLYKQGYRIVGNHSAIKVCMWTKKAIKNEDVCYKSKFYSIQTHRCVQMTPSLHVCSQRCIWCWRDIDFTRPQWNGKIDSPEFIIEGCIKEHIRYLQGFGGNKKTNIKKYKEAQEPIHFAISLSGEPTFYPRLPELIDQLKERKITSFLVTNGTNPTMVKKLIEHQPTQLYITLPAPNERIYEECCRPLSRDNWKNILKSLMLLKDFKRSVMRLTLVKNKNMLNPKEYAELIRVSSPSFVECKAYMWVGYSRERLKQDNMPSHTEVKEFAKKIAKYSNYIITDEKENSRVVLLVKNSKIKIKL